VGRAGHGCGEPHQLRAYRHLGGFDGKHDNRAADRHHPGTATITSYTVTASTGGTAAKTQSVPASQCTGAPAQCGSSMTGLTATSAYTFTVTATSAAGTSPVSPATNAVTPQVAFASAPVMLSSASAATLRYVKTDGTLLFEQPPSQVTGLARRPAATRPAGGQPASAADGNRDRRRERSHSPTG
jgi:hypothetical protein